jgi:hypothetical protein
MLDITADDINAYLADEDNFSLELFVYHSLLQCGLRSAHGGAYIDPVTDKYRQFDIRVQVNISAMNALACLAIECKKLSPEFPLVVSRVPRSKEEASHSVIRSRGREGSDHFAEELSTADGESRLYRIDAPVGKFTFQLQKDVARNDPSRITYKSTDSDSYDKWSQALASANDFIEAGRIAHLTYKAASYCTSILPILVVPDGTLWVVDYDENGQRSAQPLPAEGCELFVGRSYKLAQNMTYTITHLHIFTQTGFVSFLRQLTDRYGSRLLSVMFGFTMR